MITPEAPVTPGRNGRTFGTSPGFRTPSPLVDPQAIAPDPRVTAIAGAVLAALVGGGGMLLLRSSLQVRSVPERLMEWGLLFVPPGAFESGLQLLGFEAKRI